jgi:putative oxygen-independent coproporphyrinogen III oxidase
MSQTDDWRIPRALYIHVPFCPKVCPYCDFHKMRRHEGLVSSYLTQLRAELLALYENHPTPLETVYLGGGTPSHLSDTELASIFEMLGASWGLRADMEVTLEADPLTFDNARLEVWKRLGINRLSIGLQSTDDTTLRFLGRLHSGKEGLQAVELALAAGFKVSADLMTAIPEQDTARDLHTLAQTGVPHISVYTLTIEPFTPFARRGVTVSEEKDTRDYALTQTVLSDYGYLRYEVSSHARPGFESRHNQVYWHGQPFLQAGPSAAGFIAQHPGSLGVRLTNPPIKDWLSDTPPAAEVVTAESYVLDVLMTGLRTLKGVDTAELKNRTGIQVTERFAAVILPLVQTGLLEQSGNTLRATKAGLLKLNAILRQLFRA